MIYSSQNPEEDDDELWDDTPSSPLPADFRQSDSDDEPNLNHSESDSDSTVDNLEEDYSEGDYSDEEYSEKDYSEAPRQEARRSRRSFFGFKSGEEDDEADFYSSDTETPEPAPKPVKPRLDPEDPDYWMEEESDLERIMPNPRSPWKWWVAAAVAAFALLIGGWVWFMRPYVDDAVKYGYIASMERRGSLMKTFEGVLIPYRELGDPTPTYFEPIPFSVESDSLAAGMKAMMLGCVPVRLEYKRYHCPLPWKGDANIVIVKADTADLDKILPPEYR